LPERNPFFTGREQLLAQVQAALAERGRAALSGLGGMGKSQTAMEHAHRHMQEYDYVLWVGAQSREALVSGYSTLASLLELPLADAKDQMLAVGVVRCWLGSHERWLLILDNVDDLATAREFLPPGKNGHVLFTTRARAVGTMAWPVEIQEMAIEEGALLLLRRARCIPEIALLEVAALVDQMKAKEITLQLGGLPLALDQAGAYIEETGCGLSGYLDLYQKHAPDLLRFRGTLSPGHADPVTSTWALSFENIEKANPAAAELLKFCAFLHPDSIPEELFSMSAPELGPVLGAIASDEFALNRAIAEILKYSLLHRDSNARILQIHRLVQAVLRQGMDEATQRSWAERALRAVNCAFPYVEFSTWSLCERLLSQADACTELIDQWRLEFPEAALLLNQAGSYLFERGRYRQAEPLYERALNIRERTLDPNHPDVAQSLNNLALIYRTLGRHEQAAPLYERALRILEQALGPHHPILAISLDGLASICSSRGHYEEAEPLYERALGIREKALGPDHPDVATCLNNLAGLFYHRGRCEQAAPLFERALQIRERALGPHHPEVALVLTNLAGLYRAQGRHEQAAPLYERAPRILEQALGPDHPNLAACLNNLAALHHDLGWYEEAEPLYERALGIREKALGPDHPDVAKSLGGLARLCADQGRYEEAAPLYERSLKIRERALAPDHLGIATNLNDLALLYHHQGCYEEAEPLYGRALKICERMLGPDHLIVAICLENYALCLRAMDRSQEAEPVEARARTIRATPR
jgi:tetratricopeptide (TPR) repeat protein